MTTPEKAYKDVVDSERHPDGEPKPLISLTLFTLTTKIVALLTAGLLFFNFGLGTRIGDRIRQFGSQAGSKNIFELAPLVGVLLL